MKTVAVSIVLCILATNFLAQPNKGSSTNQNQSTEHARPTASHENNQKPVAQTETTKDRPPRWYTSSEWWLVVIAFLTGLAIAYQAREMSAATRVMRGQLTAISRQSSQMDESIAVARDTANATRDNVQIIINKERARIRIEVSEDPNLYPYEATELDHLTFKIFCEGPTPAFIIKSYANLRVSDSKTVCEIPPAQIPMSLPAVLHPDPSGQKKNAYLWQTFDQDLEPLLLAEQSFLHFYGVVEYTDVFEIPRYTKFRYVWSVSNRPFYGGRHGYWIKNGSSEDNKAT